MKLKLGLIFGLLGVLHANAAESTDAQISGCNAKEIAGIKHLYSDIQSLPQPRDEFGINSKYIEALNRIKPKATTFLYRAYEVQDSSLTTQKKSIYCGMPSVRYDSERRVAIFTPETTFEGVSVFLHSKLDTSQVNTIRLKYESENIRPYYAGNAFGTKTQVTGYVASEWTVVLFEGISVPYRVRNKEILELEMTPEDARNILPRLLVKISIEPVVSVDSVQYSRRKIRSHEPTLDAPKDFKDVTYYFPGRLISFDVFDPKTGVIYTTLDDMMRGKQTGTK